GAAVFRGLPEKTEHIGSMSILWAGQQKLGEFCQSGRITTISRLSVEHQRALDIGLALNARSIEARERNENAGAMAWQSGGPRKRIRSLRQVRGRAEFTSIVPCKKLVGIDVGIGTGLFQPRNGFGYIFRRSLSSEIELAEGSHGLRPSSLCCPGKMFDNDI